MCLVVSFVFMYFTKQGKKEKTLNKHNKSEYLSHILTCGMNATVMEINRGELSKCISRLFEITPGHFFRSP